YRKAWETPEGERTEGQRLNARQVEALFKQIQSDEIKERMSAGEIEEIESLRTEISRLAGQRPEPYPTARTITEENSDPLPSYFLHRGDPGSKGSRMDPGVLSVAKWQPVSLEPPPAEAETSHQRRQFAEWI